MAENEQQILESAIKKLQQNNGDVNSLTDEEKQVYSNFAQEIEKDRNNLMNDIQNNFNSGTELNDGQLSKLQELQQRGIIEPKLFEHIMKNNDEIRHQFPHTLESKQSKKRFDVFDEENKNGGKIIHITDSHSKPYELEGIILQTLHTNKMLIPDETGKGNHKHALGGKNILALTGDIITDFFDFQNEGQETFLEEAILNKSGLSKDEASRFSKIYKQFLRFAGVTEQMIRENDPALQGNGQGNGPIDILRALIAGSYEPQGLTSSELLDFRKEKVEIQKLFDKGIRNHSSKQYQEIAKIFKKYGLTGDHVVLTSGNHDIPEEMEKVLGEYMITPEKRKKVGEYNLANITRSANGNFMGGPDFNNLFGYAGLREKADEFFIKDDEYQSLFKKVEKYGIGEKDLKKYMKQSIQRASMGFKTGALEKLHDKIQNKVSTYLKKEISRIDDMKFDGVDAIIQHTKINDPQRAGLEELAAHQALVKNKFNGAVLYGHEHAQDSHRKDGIFYLNPGSAAAGNSGVHLFDENKKYSSSLFTELDDRKISSYKHFNRDELPSMSSQGYGKRA